MLRRLSACHAQRRTPHHAHRYQSAGTGIGDWPSQGPTLGKHLLQATSSWAQAPSAH
jgi:hypothetical protein